MSRVPESDIPRVPSEVYIVVGGAMILFGVVSVLIGTVFAVSV